jgi:hypothetical protein
MAYEIQTNSLPTSSLIKQGRGYYNGEGGDYKGDAAITSLEPPIQGHGENYQHKL